MADSSTTSTLEQTLEQIAKSEECRRPSKEGGASQTSGPLHAEPNRQASKMSGAASLTSIEPIVLSQRVQDLSKGIGEAAQAAAEARLRAFFKEFGLALDDLMSHCGSGVSQAESPESDHGSNFLAATQGDRSHDLGMPSRLSWVAPSEVPLQPMGSSVSMTGTRNQARASASISFHQQNLKVLKQLSEQKTGSATPIARVDSDWSPGGGTSSMEPVCWAGKKHSRRLSAEMITPIKSPSKRSNNSLLIGAIGSGGKEINQESGRKSGLSPAASRQSSTAANEAAAAAGRTSTARSLLNAFVGRVRSRDSTATDGDVGHSATKNSSAGANASSAGSRGSIGSGSDKSCINSIPSCNYMQDMLSGHRLLQDVFDESFLNEHGRDGNFVFASPSATAGRTSMGRNSTGMGSITSETKTLNGLRNENDISLSRTVLPGSEAERELEDATGFVSNIFPWVMTWLRIWGLMPCNQLKTERCGAQHLNRYFVIAIGMAIFVWQCIEIPRAKAEDRLEHSLSDITLACGTLACLMCSRILHRHHAFSSDVVLLAYATKYNFQHSWRLESQKNLLLSVVGWVLIVATRVLLGGIGSFRGIQDGFFATAGVAPPSPTHIVAYAFNTGIFTAVAFCLLHFMIALKLATDSFAFRFLSDPDYVRAATEWDTLRAILRLGSAAVWRLCMVPAVTSTLVFLLCCADVLLHEDQNEETLFIGGGLPVLGPAVMMTCMMSYVLLAAANVTSTCQRLPPIINSFHLSADNDDMWRLVQYMKDSAAGFYIGDVLLTASTVIKTIYIGLMVLLTIIMKALSQNQI